MYVPSNTCIHFVGIGGIGMSGIAEVLFNLGYLVRGSDISQNQNTKRLQDLGVKVFIGHDASYVHGCQVVVVSSDIRPQNPEIIEAQRLSIPVIKRAEMLCELMRLKKSVAIAGSHGKTTTTSLAAALLEKANLDPTVVNGGIINAYNTNARLGSSEWIVVETDESDGTLTKIFPTIAVVTNIDPEHLDFYKNIAQLHQAFESFLHNLPFYGCAILCNDHPVVKELSQKLKERRFITYGLSEGSFVRGTNIRSSLNGTFFDVTIAKEAFDCTHNEKVKNKRIEDLFISLIGEHNVQNALSVVSIALELGLDESTIREAFLSFKGVKRRFTKVGMSQGVTIIDDYAHHPIEIQTVIKAAKAAHKGRVVVLVQPHRYTRLTNLFDDFVQCMDGAEVAIIAPVYSAGEELKKGYRDSQDLIKAMKDAKIVPIVIEMQDSKELPYIVRSIAKPGDMIVCMGAGSITYWASLLPSQLDQIYDSSYVSLSPLSSQEMPQGYMTA